MNTNHRINETTILKASTVGGKVSIRRVQTLQSALGTPFVREERLQPGTRAFRQAAALLNLA